MASWLQGFRKTVPDRWEFANDCFRKGEKRLLSDIQRRKILASPAVPTAVAVVAPLPENRAAASPMNSGGDEEVSPSVSPPRAAAPSTSTPGNGGASPGLVEDNNRLRKENQRLKQEVSRIKSLCSNIHNLMSKYACQQLPHRPRPQPETAEKPPAPASPLELMPMTRCSVSSEAASPCRDDRADPEDEEFEEEEEEVDEGMPNPRLFGVSIGAKRARSREGERARDEQPQRRRQVVEVKLEPLDPRPPPEGGGHRWRVCSSSCRSPHRGVCS
uniref:Heat stress transcription factor B-2a n=1 Tax=Anthurium amnicola TaxID=1678845 RepID=A0A1D1XRA4_9ARAE